MAVKDSVYAQVAGTVERVSNNPKAPITIAVVLSSRDKYPSRVKVWPNGFTLSEGDRVKVKGYLSWKLNRYEKDGETKHNVEVFVNSAELVEREEAQQATQQPAQDDGWNVPSNQSTDTPF